MVTGCMNQEDHSLFKRLAEEKHIPELSISRSAEAVFWVDLKANFFQVNEIACNLTGYSRTKLLCMTLYDLIPHLASATWSNYWQETKKCGYLTFECSYKTAAGKLIPILASLTSLQHNHSEYGCLTVQQRTSPAENACERVNRVHKALASRIQEDAARLNVAEKYLSREKAERLWIKSELDKSNSLLQSVLESTVDGIAAIDLQGRIISFNQKLVEMWQIPEAIVNSENSSHWLAFYRSQIKNVDALNQCLQEIESQPELEGFNTLELKNGKIFEQYFQPQRVGKQIVGQVWSFRDVTHFKQAEAEMQAALKQERELGELKSRFVSMVSHEFRNPLNIISFSTSLLQRHHCHWNKEKQQEYFHHIRAAITLLDQLMDAVLIIGRSDASKLKFEPSEIDLDQFCRALISQFQLNDAQHHTLTFTNQSGCLTANIDEKLLQPILSNLLSNAIKYSLPESLIELRLSCQNQQITLQIIDQGIGIPESDIPHLFEPFYRARNVGDISGTGLGLAVVQRLVEAHCGKITVNSEIGIGTTFIITFPA